MDRPVVAFCFFGIALVLHSHSIRYIQIFRAGTDTLLTGASGQQAVSYTHLDVYKRQGSTDLSRRAIVYSMQGLSFREYLEMFHHIKIPAYSLTDIIQHRAELPDKFRPYAYFQSYLEQGYYPFSKEDQLNIRLQQVINKTLEVDIPQYAEMSISTTRKLKQLLIIIAQSVPCLLYTSRCV